MSAVVLNQLVFAPDASAAENAALIAELENVRVIELPWLPDPDDLVRASELILEPVIDELERTGRPLAER